MRKTNGIHRFLCFAWTHHDLMGTERGVARRLFWRLFYIGWPEPR